jgi:hypothetical protein
MLDLNHVAVAALAASVDAQLQDALFDFQRTAGVVATIKSEGASKSGQLAEALGAGKKIIVSIPISDNLWWLSLCDLGISDEKHIIAFVKNHCIRTTKKVIHHARYTLKRITHSAGQAT